MLSFEQIIKIDPINTAKLTDEELENIRQSLYEFGQLMYEDWYRQKFSSKSPLGSLTTKGDEHTI